MQNETKIPKNEVNEHLEEELYMLIDGVNYKIIEGIGYTISPEEAYELGFFIDYDEYNEKVFSLLLGNEMED